MRRAAILLCVFLIAHAPLGAWAMPSAAAPEALEAPAAQPIPAPVYLPLVYHQPPAPGQPPATYETLPVFSAPTNPPAERHPDLNLALRGYAPTDAALALVDYGGATDPLAPRLTGLVAPARIADIVSVHRVYTWDWARGARGVPISSPPVTLVGLGVRPGEAIHLPPSGYDIGSGYQALVLYAAPERLTLKYTREDNVVEGYTLHLEGLAVHPTLLAAYRAADAAGRGALPALRAGQVLGVAAGDEVRVAIRDAGAFMDPRSRKDWW